MYVDVDVWFESKSEPKPEPEPKSESLPFQGGRGAGPRLTHKHNRVQRYSLFFTFSQTLTRFFKNTPKYRS